MLEFSYTGIGSSFLLLLLYYYIIIVVIIIIIIIIIISIINCFLRGPTLAAQTFFLVSVGPA